MIMAFSAFPMRDLDTRDELGTPVGSELERDEEVRCYCMPYLLFTPSPVLTFSEKSCPVHYSITFLSHLPFSRVLSLIYCTAPLPERSWSTVRFDDLPLDTRLLATGQSSTSTRIPRRTANSRS